MIDVIELLGAVPVPVSTETDLLSYTTFRIGGRAAFFVEPENLQQLKDILRIASASGIRTLILGRGSNLLIDDRGFNGLVVRTGKINRLERSDDNLTAECGVTLAELAKSALDAGLTGAEFLYGIPGSVGGALRMNAGAFGGEMKDIVRCAECYDAKHDRTVTLSGNELALSYRNSIFSERRELTVLRVTFTLMPGDREAIRATMDDYMKRRLEKQPLNLPSAGSFFKRPAGSFAGKLIEECGLKGILVGDAQVSEKHAGFIVNRGSATAEDVRRLCEQVQDTVRAATGVCLEPEVIFVPYEDGTTIG